VRLIGFAVDKHRLDHLGQHRLHDGMLLYIADYYAGYRAAKAVQRACVTLAMQARRLGEAKLGEWVEFRSNVPFITPSVVFVDGSFHSVDRPLMTVSCAFKVLKSLPVPD
jgi:acyl-coenzyme A thioesterase PaaI-like protein